MGFGIIEQSQPLYCLEWETKNERIFVCAPNKEDAEELFEWLAQYTEMKKVKE